MTSQDHDASSPAPTPIVSDSTATQNSSWYKWVPLFLLILGLFLVYGQTAWFAFVNWDDTRYVYSNPVLLYPEKMTWWDRWFPHNFGYPLPLTLLSYRIDQWFYGVPTTTTTDLALGWGYHITNLIIWVMIVVLLYVWCLRLVRSHWATFVGVALFVFHPTTAETVAWVTGRKELLLALFTLGALLALQQLGKDVRLKTTLALLAWSVAALLSKPNAVFLLPFGLWYVVVYLSPDLETSERRTLWIHSTTAGAVLAVLSGISVYLGMIWQSKLGAVETSRSVFDILDRALWAFGYHLGLLFYPVGLRIKYIVEPNGFDIYHGLGILGILFLLVLLLHPKTRRSPAGIGAALFATAYLPVSNLMPLRRFLADTYLFLPMLGIALMVAYGSQQLKTWHQQTIETRLVHRWTSVAAVLLLVTFGGLLGTLTWKQVRVWKDSPSLWENVYRYHPRSPRICRMLGNSYNRTKQLKKAVTVYHRCIRHFGPRMYRNNLAITYLLLQDWRNAKKQFLLLRNERPNDRRAHYYLKIIEHRYEKNLHPRKR